MEEAIAEIDGSKEKTEVIDLPLKWHEEFDNIIWQGKPSFHNRSHIEATLEASRTYVKSADRDNDPLGLYEGLDKWNVENPDFQIKEDELDEALDWTFLGHDLGNFLKGVEVKENRIDPDFLDTYTSMGAEERSQQIVGLLLSQSSLDENKRRRFIPFVRHLVSETTYNIVDPDAPFAAFMRTIDQIGNDLFSDNDKRVEGLVTEMVSENPDAELVPYNFVNFTRVRLGQLLTDEASQNKLLKNIWKKQLPEERSEFSKKRSKAKVLLKDLQSQERLAVV